MAEQKYRLHHDLIAMFAWAVLLLGTGFMHKEIHRILELLEPPTLEVADGE